MLPLLLISVGCYYYHVRYYYYYYFFIMKALLFFTHNTEIKLHLLRLNCLKKLLEITKEVFYSSSQESEF